MDKGSSSIAGSLVALVAVGALCTTVWWNDPASGTGRSGSKPADRISGLVVSLPPVDRGASDRDDRLRRDTNDDGARTLDVDTRKSLWAAPVASPGLVFVSGGSVSAEGIRGRMYAVDAATGAIVWEFLPGTGGGGGPARPGDSLHTGSAVMFNVTRYARKRTDVGL